VAAAAAAVALLAAVAVAPPLPISTLYPMTLLRKVLFLLPIYRIFWKVFPVPFPPWPTFAKLIRSNSIRSAQVPRARNYSDFYREFAADFSSDSIWNSQFAHYSYSAIDSPAIYPPVPPNFSLSN
jgi:hypothetical protein